ncbi:hypothetical protein CJF42_14110 [Pseudoalteromonas sp. NBT06-2]|uniref:hypothetical protein n=1 Tax=Pseudoalteromonas sp. NBT06-2 TaxID=2025950 RepID=UPI000BA7C860|nr:hypothetical protein [Pseudoalteromonas sp. NBT06-2]PAJ73776.1 hypothetical protein CJF42_14110 [Pseudoalteromonas sp. NBT06-2]
MDLALGTNLTLPLFLLDETLQNRDPEKPDFSIDIILDEDLVAHMCQAPEADSSIAIYINQYELINMPDEFKLFGDEHVSQIQVTQGPSIAALVQFPDGTTFVSPQMDFLPTFDMDVEEGEE